jgi:hypothetical protein
VWIHPLVSEVNSIVLSGVGDATFVAAFFLPTHCLALPANEFSTAAFRVGHTMLTGNFHLADSNGVFGGPIAMKDIFFKADFFDNDPDRIDHVLAGLQENLAQEIDPQVIEDVRGFLFGAPNGAGTCLDLTALNIQRGRDHGLPSYNALRVAMGLESYTSFAQVTSDVARQTKLASLYGDVNNVDLWAGMLSEDHVEGASVGELLGTVFNNQFTRLMLGDPFFYLSDADLANLHLKKHVIDINQLTLQYILNRNTVVQHPDDRSAFVQGLKTIPLSTIRSIDGTDRPDGLGAADDVLIRLGPLSYPDGKGDEIWQNTNPRNISNVLFKETNPITNDRKLLDMVS